MAREKANVGPIGKRSMGVVYLVGALLLTGSLASCGASGPSGPGRASRAPRQHPLGPPLEPDARLVIVVSRHRLEADDNYELYIYDDGSAILNDGGMAGHGQRGTGKLPREDVATLVNDLQQSMPDRPPPSRGLDDCPMDATGVVVTLHLKGSKRSGQSGGCPPSTLAFDECVHRIYRWMDALWPRAQPGR